MIRTFGNIKRNQSAYPGGINSSSLISANNNHTVSHSGTNQWGMTEELRDEHFTSRLSEALELKNIQKNNEAIAIYQEVLNQEFLKDSIVEKHVFMKFNAFKNSGELHERIGDFKTAKSFYTQALKIKEKEPYIWTRLGFIEYEVFKDNQIAKKCFEAAAQTCTTLERRSAKINAILVKLAEIYFQEFDFKASEQMVDAIIQRLDQRLLQSVNIQIPSIYPPQSQDSAIFAYLMKSFFLSLKNESTFARMFVDRAKQIKQTAEINDLDIIKKMVKGMKLNISSRDIVVANSENQQEKYSILQQKNEANNISIEPVKDNYASAIECIDDFFLQLCITLERASQEEPLYLDTAKLNLDLYIQQLSNILGHLTSQGSQQIPLLLIQDEKPYFDALKIQDDNLNNIDHQNSTVQVNTVKEVNKKQQKEVQSNNQRTLRRKPDSTEQQMKQYTVRALKEYMDFIIDRNYSCGEAIGNPEFEEVISHKEIINAKSFLEQQVSAGETENVSMNIMNNGLNNDLCSFQDAQDRLSIYGSFLSALLRLNGKSVFFSLRCLIRFCLEDHQRLTLFLNFNLSSYLYRLFVLLLKSDFSKKSLDQVFGPYLHPEEVPLLALFEVALFNKQTSKDLKSFALIQQREQLFDYLSYKEQEFVYSLAKESSQANKTKIRMYYAMMHYSFEIKNNMHSSIKYYQKLQETKEEIQNGFPIQMQWVSLQFKIDESKVSEYGGVKITKAQIVKENDEELIQLKKNEVKENEEAKKQNVQRSVMSKVKPEFTKFACFYIDQLCHYLQKSCQNGEPGQNNQTTNEEKIKEMWDKLSHSICRCPTNKMIKLVNSLFSVLTAFQYLNKLFYEQFILKKLEFEPLITELQDRLKLIYTDVVLDHTKKSYSKKIFDLQQVIFPALQAEILDQGCSSDILTLLSKTQYNLLRLLSQEFLFHHIISQVTAVSQTNQLMNAYFHSIYFIEVFSCILRSTEQQSLQDQLMPVIMLLKKLDKLSFKNNEVFIKSYFRLLVSAYPFLITVFANSTDQIEENDLLQVVLSLMGYFFDIKVNFQKENGLAGDQASPEEEEGSQAEEEKKSYKLKCLEKMREKGPRYWQIILSTLMPQMNNNTQQTEKGSNSLQQLQYIYTVANVIDCYVLRDTAMICNALACGRFMAYGQMTFKDVTNISMFVDTLARYLLDNERSITEQKAQTNNGVQFSQKYQIFKDSIDQKGNPLNFNSQLANLREQESDKAYIDSISYISFFLMNVASHFALDNASPQQIVWKTNTAKRKKILDNQLYSLYGGNQLKFLKNLRSISSINIVYSEFKIEELLLHSQYQAEFFILANNCKLAQDYKIQDKYGSFKKKYNNALNTILIVIQQIFIQIRDQQLQLNIDHWGNLNIISKLKQAFSQALFIIASKLEANKFLIKRSPKSYLDQAQISNAPHDLFERKAMKVRNLSEICKVLAILCEKLEKLVIIGEDPRIGAGKSKDINLAILSLVEIFLSCVQGANHSSFTDRVRFFLPQDQIDSFISKIESLTSEYKQRMDQISHKASFEYPYLQGIFSRVKISQSQLSNNSFNSEFEDLTYLVKSLEIAFANHQPKACLEVFIRVLRRSLHLGIVLKYEGDNMDKSEFEYLKQKYESVRRLLIDDNKAIFKMLVSYLQPDLIKSSQIKQDENVDFIEIRSSNGGAAGGEDDFQILLDNAVSTSKARPEFFKSDQMPEFNAFETSLHNLYKLGDQLYMILSNSSYCWIRARLQYNLVKELEFEISRNPIMKDKLDGPINQKLSEMMYHVIKIIENNDEQENGSSNFFQEDQKKNLVSQLNLNEIALSEFRIRLKQYFIRLSEKFKSYENIKDQFKKLVAIAKQQEKFVQNLKEALMINSGASILPIQRTIEFHTLFKVCKDKYISTIYERIRIQMDIYMKVRKRLKNSSSKSKEIIEQYERAYYDVRSKFSITQETIPQMLRDIFELLIDSHAKKSILIAKNWIDDEQKRTIKQAVLLACGFCGPDSEIQNEKTTSTFLDLDRISNDEEYEFEGLVISIKWYIQQLENRPIKKEGEIVKKLKQILDYFENKVKEQQAVVRNSIMQYPQIASNLAMEGENCDANIARQVFNERTD